VTTKKAEPTKKTDSKDEKQEDKSGLKLEDVAKEALDGKWGLGQDRRRRLSDAGYDPNEVQAEVVRLMNE
jgi:type VI protein secretion system component VasK